MDRWDVVVVGAGAMGSATAWWLARRRRRVLLLDRFEAGHTRGSSHGASRIFRLAYPVDDYVVMAAESLRLWRVLENETKTSLLAQTGAVDHGPLSTVGPVAAALDRAGVEHETMDPDAAARRWPGMRFEGTVLWHGDGGRIDSDRSVAVLQRAAAGHGADVRLGCAAAEVVADGGGALVRTDGGDERAAVVVVTAGAWNPGLLAGLAPLPPMVVTEESVFHFRPAAPHPWPSFIHHGRPVRYGLLSPGEGVKVAEHHTGRTVDPDDRLFTVDPVSRQRVEEYVAEWFPGLEPHPVTEATCLYTTTPTEDFVLDRIGPIVVGAGFSGHGFKFTPLIGRLLADLAEGRSGPGGRFALPT